MTVESHEPATISTCLSNKKETYHVGVERRGDLLGVEVVPVDGGKEYVVLDFNL